MTHKNFKRAIELSEKIEFWKQALEQLNKPFRIMSVVITDFDGHIIQRDINTNDKSSIYAPLSPEGLNYVEMRKKELQRFIDEAEKEFETL